MADHAAPKTGINLSNTAYDILRRIVEIVLPGLGTLYFTVSEIWGLLYGKEVVGTIAAVTVFLALVLGFSRRAYEGNTEYDGAIVPDESDPDNPVYRFLLNTDDADAVLNKKAITFKGLSS